MERMSFESSYVHEGRIEDEPLSNFESETKVPESELESFVFDPFENRFEADSGTERGVEALWHSESKTLVVPQPPGARDTAEALVLMSLPVTGFIDQTRPDIVIGADRGGRLFSLAVHRMWREIGDEHFPTLDGKLHFGRLSKSVPREDVAEVLGGIVDKSVDQARRTDNEINGDRPHILIIDDWIASGRTRRHIEAALDDLGLLGQINMSFVVMSGEAADASGSDDGVDVDPGHFADNEEVIGVGYRNGAEPYPVRTRQSRKIRKAIHSAVEQVGLAIRKRSRTRKVGAVATQGAL